MWPFRYKHEHRHEPVARSPWPPANPGGVAAVMAGAAGRTGDRQVVTMRCWCGDLYTRVMDGRPTLAEMLGLGAEAQEVRHLRDKLKADGVGLDPMQAYYLGDVPTIGTPADASGGSGFTATVPAGGGGPGGLHHLGGGEWVGGGGRSQDSPPSGVITGGPGVQVPEWPDQVRPPEGGGGVVPHLPVTDPQATSSWRCTACGLPIAQVSDGTPWRTLGTGSEACDQGEPGWEQQP